MNALRKLLRLLRLVELVWLEDHDGGVVLRIARRHPLGFYYAYRFRFRQVRLRDGGITTGASYVERWHPYTVSPYAISDEQQPSGKP